MRLIDLTGKRFGFLVVQQRGPNTASESHPRLQWFCDCDCGKKNILRVGENLKSGHTKSCGCSRGLLLIESKNTHGMCRRGKVSTEYQMYRHAKERANKEKVPFDLCLEDIKIPEFCPMLGLRLSRGTGKLHDASPTVDRIVSTQGYTKKNTLVIS